MRFGCDYPPPAADTLPGRASEDSKLRSAVLWRPAAFPSFRSLSFGKVNQNQSDLFWGAETVNRSSNRCRGGRFSRSKCVSISRPSTISRFLRLQSLSLLNKWSSRKGLKLPGKSGVDFFNENYRKGPITRLPVKSFDQIWAARGIRSVQAQKLYFKAN